MSSYLFASVLPSFYPPVCHWDFKLTFSGPTFGCVLHDSTPCFVGASVCQSVRLLLPKRSSDLKYSCCQPTHDLGSHVSSLVCFQALRLVLQSFKLALWAEPLKGMKSCRTQGEFFLSICLFVYLFVHLCVPPRPCFQS